jgi:hypothetical protein
MTARYEMTKQDLKAKQMRNEVLAQFNTLYYYGSIFWVVTNTYVKEGDMATPGMPLVSIEGASKLEVSAMVSETDITSKKMESAF